MMEGVVKILCCLFGGNAISGAPNINGTNQFSNPPIIIGITMKKTVTKAWAVIMCTFAQFKMVWILQEWIMKECRNTYWPPECNERGKAEGHGRCTDEDWSEDNGNKIWACVGQRPEVMEEDLYWKPGSTTDRRAWEEINRIAVFYCDLLTLPLIKSSAEGWPYSALCL